MLLWVFCTLLVACHSFRFPRRVEAGKEAKPRDQVHIVVPSAQWSGLAIEAFDVPNYLGHLIRQPACDKKCTYSVFPKDVSKGDAVLFEGLDLGWMNQAYVLHPIHLPEKQPGQFWINFGYETHSMVPLLNSPEYMANIDANMTFDQNSDIPISFTCDWGDEKGLKYLSETKGTKKQGIAYVASNCYTGGASDRTKYVQELMKYIPVDSYGGCLKNKEWPPNMRKPIYDDHGKSMQNKIELFRDYKFVLAFENNNITDYVTEKLMCVFKSGAIPIYMGAPNVDEWIPGDKSIIKTSDFKGPKDLADYLNSLVINPEKYEAHLKWKKEPLKKSFMEKWDRCIFSGSSCRLCKRVHEMRENRPLMVKTPARLALSLGDASLVLPRVEGLLNFTTAYTFAMWVFPRNQHQSQRLIERGTAGSIDGFTMDLFRDDVTRRTNLRLCAAHKCASGVRPIIANNWHHVAVVFDSTVVDGVKFYVNGKLDYVYSFHDYPTDIAHYIDIVIGATSRPLGQYKFDGLVDDISMWQRALSHEEVRALQFQQLFGDEIGLAASFTFNDRINSTHVLDESVNEAHATIIGTVEYVEDRGKPLLTNKWK